MEWSSMLNVILLSKEMDQTTDWETARHCSSSPKNHYASLTIKKTPQHPWIPACPRKWLVTEYPPSNTEHALLFWNICSHSPVQGTKGYQIPEYQLESLPASPNPALTAYLPARDCLSISSFLLHKTSFPFYYIWILAEAKVMTDGLPCQESMNQQSLLILSPI